MILSFAIDAVEINRFNNWHKYSISTLSRIFSKNEIDYCLSNHAKSAERFAARFACKEAAYKALSNFNNLEISFLKFCGFVKIENKLNGCPIIVLNKENLINKNYSILIDSIDIIVSITHTKTVAIASIIITKITN